MEAGIDLFCSQETAITLKLSGHRLCIIEAMKQLKIGTWSVLPFDGIHDVPVLGFLIMNGQGERLLFLIDSVYSKYRFKNLKHIMIGINYCNDMLRKNIQCSAINATLGRRIMQTHCSLQSALDFLKINVCSDTESVHILHISNANADKDRIKDAVQRQTGKLVLI